MSVQSCPAQSGRVGLIKISVIRTRKKMQMMNNGIIHVDWPEALVPYPEQRIGYPRGKVRNKE